MIAVLTAAVIYLMYQNFLAEDMLKDMDRDYEELCEEMERYRAEGPI